MTETESKTWPKEWVEALKAIKWVAGVGVAPDSWDAVLRVLDGVGALRTPSIVEDAEIAEIEDQLDFVVGCNGELTLGPNACATLLRIVRERKQEKPFMAEEDDVWEILDEHISSDNGSHKGLGKAAQAILSAFEVRKKS
jgi:hypothetical protein